MVLNFSKSHQYDGDISGYLAHHRDLKDIFNRFSLKIGKRLRTNFYRPRTWTDEQEERRLNAISTRTKGRHQEARS